MATTFSIGPNPKAPDIDHQPIPEEFWDLVKVFSKNGPFNCHPITHMTWPPTSSWVLHLHGCLCSLFNSLNWGCSPIHCSISWKNMPYTSASPHSLASSPPPGHGHRPSRVRQLLPFTLTPEAVSSFHNLCSAFTSYCQELWCRGGHLGCGCQNVPHTTRSRPETVPL